MHDLAEKGARFRFPNKVNLNTVKVGLRSVGNDNSKVNLYNCGRGVSTDTKADTHLFIYAA